MIHVRSLFVTNENHISKTQMHFASKKTMTIFMKWWIMIFYLQLLGRSKKEKEKNGKL
jgi:hypothetical protein